MIYTIFALAVIILWLAGGAYLILWAWPVHAGIALVALVAYVGGSAYALLRGIVWAATPQPTRREYYFETSELRQGRAR